MQEPLSTHTFQISKFSSSSMKRRYLLIRSISHQSLKRLNIGKKKETNDSAQKLFRPNLRVWWSFLIKNIRK